MTVVTSMYQGVASVHGPPQTKAALGIIEDNEGLAVLRV